MRQAAPAPRAAVPKQASQPTERQSKVGPYLAVAVVLVVVGILTVPRLFRGTSDDSQAASSPEQESAAAQRRPAKVATTNSAIAPSNEKGANAQSERDTTSVRAVKPEGVFSVPDPALAPSREKATRRGLAAGQVAQQVLPDVPPSARRTIHGKISVGVRVSVDSSGKVTDAELDSSGPSKYFARLAMEAAQRWTFDPPKVDGRSVLSDWVLHFEFTGNGTKVVPVEATP